MLAQTPSHMPTDTWAPSLARTWSRQLITHGTLKQASIDALIGSRNGIKAETDLAIDKASTSNPPAVSAALLDARNSALTKDAFNGRHESTSGGTLGR